MNIPKQLIINFHLHFLSIKYKKFNENYSQSVVPNTQQMIQNQEVHALLVEVPKGNISKLLRYFQFHIALC